jgi:glycosyltransferase involved in cell wall biosynthesis
MPFKLLIDGSALRAHQGGLRTYILGLVRALADRPDLAITLVTPFPAEAHDVGDATVVPTGVDTTNPLRRALWRMSSLRSLIESTEAKVLLIPLHEMPLRKVPIPTIMVVHDVGAIAAPALYGRAAWARYTATLGWACSAASAVVCVSNASFLELHLTTGVEPNKCRVIGEGPQLLETGEESGPAPVDGPYVLYVGSMYRFKNVPTLVHAFHDTSLPAKLVMVGPISRAERAELDGWRSGLPAGRVEHRGFVPPGELALLYQHAVAVALPSLHEGFGLPALEAMRADVPLVASPVSAIREVAGDAALYVDQPLHPQAWSNALHLVCGDSARRADMVSRGRERASAHSWQRVADDFAGLAEELARRTRLAK